MHVQRIVQSSQLPMMANVKIDHLSVQNDLSPLMVNVFLYAILTRIAMMDYPVMQNEFVSLIHNVLHVMCA